MDVKAVIISLCDNNISFG